MKVLITGATGFIGSNIAKGLLEQGYKVYATFRTTSSFEKCIDFKHEINWINLESSNWKEQIININLEQLIHTAWGGIKTDDRNNWELQITNFWFSKEIFDLAKECNIKKVISLGSQAEYGTCNFPSNETTATFPNDAYGSVKLLAANYFRNLFKNTTIEWYWIRIYSVFGEDENDQWLIPTVISKLINNETIPLTLCKQEYDYMYIKDFFNQLLTIVTSSKNKSGIYNICNDESIILEELLNEITNIMRVSPTLLQFGSIPYRQEQNMCIIGDNTKFKKCFKSYENNIIGLKEGLIKSIEYYKKKQL